MNIKQLCYGISTFFPGLANFHAKGTGGTNSARYCYGVWLRHLVLARENGLIDEVPRVVGELGPGDSIGIGLAALLSGTEKYYGMDVLAHASLRQHLPMVDQMVELFARRADIPNEREFPNLKPQISSYAFPAHLLSDKHLSVSLAPERVQKIKRSLENCDGPATMIKYAAPWYNDIVIENESIDMIYSQAVLEHVDDLNSTYNAMFRWLKRGGCLSHQVDFKSHDLMKAWNGHWTISDGMWRLMRGRRAYLLNREPHSTHLRLLAERGFEAICDMTFVVPSQVERRQLARRFRNISEEDLTTSGAFIQAVKSLN